jgi:hypothetical protein
MRRLLHRWFRCAKGEHRDRLDMKRWDMSVVVPPTLVVHTLAWQCVDCGRRVVLGESDNFREEWDAGRMT